MVVAGATASALIGGLSSARHGEHSSKAVPDINRRIAGFGSGIFEAALAIVKPGSRTADKNTLRATS
ncbi:MAG: hypothetical protein ABWY82_19045 [Tardiphaga sp.]